MDWQTWQNQHMSYNYVVSEETDGLTDMVKPTYVIQLCNRWTDRHGKTNICHTTMLWVKKQMDWQTWQNQHMSYNYVVSEETDGLTDMVKPTYVIQLCCEWRNRWTDRHGETNICHTTMLWVKKQMDWQTWQNQHMSYNYVVSEETDGLTDMAKPTYVIQLCCEWRNRWTDRHGKTNICHTTMLWVKKQMDWQTWWNQHMPYNYVVSEETDGLTDMVKPTYAIQLCCEWRNRWTDRHGETNICHTTMLWVKKQMDWQTWWNQHMPYNYVVSGIKRNWPFFANQGA